MAWFDTKRSYGFVSIYFHITIALIFIVQLVFGFGLSFVPSDLKSSSYMLHKSMGIIIFWLVILRIINALIYQFRPSPIGTSYVRLQQQITTKMLYCVMVVMPLSGWIMSTIAKRYPKLPFIGAWGFPISRLKIVGSITHEIHIVGAYLALILILYHLSIYTYLKYYKGFNVDKRMFKLKA